MVPLLAADISPTMLFIAGAMLVVSMVFRWSRRRSRTRAKSAHGSSGRAAHGHAAAGDESPSIAPASLGQWEVKMHELNRDLSGQLDTKIRIVQQLVLRAEDQTARLEAALQRAEELLEQLHDKP